MSGFFQSEVDEIKEILDVFKNFVISNHKGVKSTEYFISLGNKTLLQAIEETFSDPNVNDEEKSKHLELMKLFLEKQKKCYSNIILSDDPEALEMKRKIEETVRFLGFSGNDPNNIFSKLENTLEKLEQGEILS